MELDDDVIKEYYELMKAGIQLPPLLVVFDGVSYWLVDGFHRRWAATKAKLKRIKVLVVSGTRDDARWMSYGVNQDHGLQRTNEDKRKATIAALKHPNGFNKSDRQIAEHVGVSDRTVNKYRAELEATAKISQSGTRTGRDGRTTNTTNIGKKSTLPLYSEPEESSDDLPQSMSRMLERNGDPTPLDHLKKWWREADATQQTLFRLWIDGEVK